MPVRRASLFGAQCGWVCASCAMVSVRLGRMYSIASTAACMAAIYLYLFAFKGMINPGPRMHRRCPRTPQQDHDQMRSGCMGQYGSKAYRYYLSVVHSDDDLPVNLAFMIEHDKGGACTAAGASTQRPIRVTLAVHAENTAVRHAAARFMSLRNSAIYLRHGRAIPLHAMLLQYLPQDCRGGRPCRQSACRRHFAAGDWRASHHRIPSLAGSPAAHKAQ